MAQTKRGLGQGFQQLVDNSVTDKSLAEVLGQANRKAALLEVDLDRIEPNPNQPRTRFADDKLAELADSIVEHGILQPIVLAEDGDKYQIISGERRFRAAKMAGLKTIPATVRTVNDQEKLELGLVENIQREDLSLLDRAIALKTLREDFAMNPEQIGRRVGYSASAVTNMIRLTSLGARARDLIATDGLSEGNARQLVGLDEKTQSDIIDLINKNGWTIRQTESYVRSLKKQGKDSVSSGGKGPASAAISSTAKTNSSTKMLQKKLGLSVSVQPMAKGGKLVIRYKSDADLDKITGYFE